MNNSIDILVVINNAKVVSESSETARVGFRTARIAVAIVESKRLASYIK